MTSPLTASAAPAACRWRESSRDGRSQHWMPSASATDLKRIAADGCVTLADRYLDVRLQNARATWFDARVISCAGVVCQRCGDALSGIAVCDLLQRVRSLDRIIQLRNHQRDRRAEREVLVGRCNVADLQRIAIRVNGGQNRIDGIRRRERPGRRPAGYARPAAIGAPSCRSNPRRSGRPSIPDCPALTVSCGALSPDESSIAASTCSNSAETVSRYAAFARA